MFDEAHNALKNSPMAGILNLIHQQLRNPRVTPPRFFGMTASWLNCKMGGESELAKHHKAMQELFAGEIHTINVPAEFLRDTSFEGVYYERESDMDR